MFGSSDTFTFSVCVEPNPYSPASFTKKVSVSVLVEHDCLYFNCYQGPLSISQECFPTDTRPRKILIGNLESNKIDNYFVGVTKEKNRKNTIYQN